MTHRIASAHALTFFAAVLGLASCGGKAAETIRPDAPTAAEAIGEIECDAAQKATAPLVVDWSSQQRVDLEVAMKRGTVALRYACDEVELLPECRIPGEYAFVGVSRKEEVVSVSSSDELKASLPVGAATLAAEVAGEAKLDLAMVLVGKASSGWTALSRADLPEACEGATHVVRAATLGAFSLARGSEGRIATTAEAFGVGAGAGSTSAKDMLTRDGDLEACQASTRDAPQAPEGCGASIRLELEPVLESAAAPKGPPPVPVIACPSGAAASGGVCKPSSEKHVCKPDDEADCSAQCDAGNLESCYHLGRLRIDWTQTGLSGAAKQDEARPLLKKACDGGVIESCVALGEVLVGEASGSGIAELRTAVTEAGALWDAACEAGSGRGCGLRAFQFSREGLLSDPAAHLPLAQRACDLGDGPGCSLLANAHIQGYGTAVDRDAGYAVLERACRAADTYACRRLAVVRYAGSDQSISPTVSGLPVDKEAGIRFGLRACGLDPDVCGIDRTIAFVDKALAQQFRADMCKAGYQPLCG